MKHNMRRFLVIGFGTVVGLVVLAGVVYFVYYAINWMPIEFSSQVWKAGTRSLRGRMVENLLKNNLVEGLNADQVRELLGEPDDESLWSGPKYATTMGWDIETYYHPCITYPRTLRLWFDEQGTCTRASVSDF